MEPPDFETDSFCRPFVQLSKFHFFIMAVMFAIRQQLEAWKGITSFRFLIEMTSVPLHGLIVSHTSCRVQTPFLILRFNTVTSYDIFIRIYTSLSSSPLMSLYFASVFTDSIMLKQCYLNTSLSYSFRSRKSKFQVISTNVDAIKNKKHLFYYIKKMRKIKNSSLY